MSDRDEQERRLARVVEDPARWAALMALAGDDELPDETDLIYGPRNERGMIFDFATLPGADDGDPAVGELIAELTAPTSLYDTLAMLCRELLRLRLEVEELRRTIRLEAN